MGNSAGSVVLSILVSTASLSHKLWKVTLTPKKFTEVKQSSSINLPLVTGITSPPVLVFCEFGILESNARVTRKVTGMEALPCASMAVQVTIVFPRGKTLPETGVQTAVPAPSTRSNVAGELYVTFVPFCLLVAAEMFDGWVILGGVVSWTVMLKLPVVEFPFASVAEQLTVVVPNAKVLPDAGEQITGTRTSTISVAVAENVTAAPDGPVASAVILDGKVRAGGAVSCTVTLKLPVAEFPFVSVAEQLTVVVVTANVLPEVGEQLTETEPSTISVAVAENVTAAPDELVASVVMLAGSVKLGTVVSCTVTLKLPVAVLPRESDVEQLTTVVAMAKVLPEAGAQVTGTGPSTRSVAEATYATTAPAGPVASAVRSAGKVKDGGVVSCTMILKLPVAVLLSVSVAEQLTVVVPNANVLPEAGAQFMATGPSTRSVAEATYVTTAPDGLVASVVMSAGRVKTGAAVSCTVTLKPPVAELP